MFETLKRRFREAGWQALDPHALQPYGRLVRVDYEPERTVHELGLGEDEFSQAVREEVFARDPFRFTEYLYEIAEPVVVEPSHGMIVARGTKLVPSLLDVHETVYVPPPHLLRYLRTRHGERRIPRAVSLRHHYGEVNYFHFVNDVLSKLRILERYPEYTEWPLLVSRAQWETRYFQAMIERAGWRDRGWVVQEDKAIACECLVAVKGLGLTRAWLEFLWRFLNVPEAPADAHRRIYLKRGAGMRRGLANQPEVEEVCRRFGFETIDSGALSLGEQIELFSHARYVVAEHGAGCTNVVFRRGQPLGLLEMMPEGHVSTCYFVICRLLGFAHRALRGPASGEGFAIDAAALEREIAALVG